MFLLHKKKSKILVKLQVISLHVLLKSVRHNNVLCIEILVYCLNLRAVKLQRYLGHLDLNLKKVQKKHKKAMAILALYFASYAKKSLYF